MNKLTEEERKWVESLKRCLKKKPKTIEILVHEMFNSDNGCQSEIHILKKGVINESQTLIDDLLYYNPSDYSLTYITVKDMAANNHGY
uniref:PH domain-containing protein n=1 Tax=Vibrio phage P018-4 TaxID=3229728 RepID=A0AB39AJG7_9CAUD